MTTQYDNLRETHGHEKCNCTGEERKMRLDPNEGICPDVKSSLDGLAIRCVGNWAFEKIYFLTQYFGIFSMGMKKKFSGKLSYIEICSGPGRCVLRNDNSEIDGTSLSVVNHPNFDFLSSALFIDFNESAVEVLNSRISALGKENSAKAVRGDYRNADSIVSHLESIPPGGLNLVFIDPTDCSIPFHTIRSIVEKLGKVDLIINFPVGTDSNRNIRPTILDPAKHRRSRTKYAAFLGSEDFFSDVAVRESARNGDHAHLRKMFRQYYIRALETLGFEYFDSSPVRNFYDIVYATANERGIEFWKKAQTYGPNNQKSLDF